MRCAGWAGESPVWRYGRAPTGGPLLGMPQKRFSGPNTPHCLTFVTFFFCLFYYLNIDEGPAGRWKTRRCENWKERWSPCGFFPPLLGGREGGLGPECVLTGRQSSQDPGRWLSAFRDLSLFWAGMRCLGLRVWPPLVCDPPAVSAHGWNRRGVCANGGPDL